MSWHNDDYAATEMSGIGYYLDTLNAIIAKLRQSKQRVTYATARKFLRHRSLVRRQLGRAIPARAAAMVVQANRQQRKGRAWKGSQS